MEKGKVKDMVYINDRLTAGLSAIPDYAVTVLEAPAGYGKTTAIKEFAKCTKDKFIWINVSNNSKEIFWADIIDAFFEVACDVESTLKTLDYPQSEKSVSEIRNIIKHAKVCETAYIVIENYHMIADKYFELLISSLIDVMPEKLHFIFLLQRFPAYRSNKPIFRNFIYYIEKEDFELTADDVVAFFGKRKLQITYDEAVWLRNFCGGWISAVCLQMENYAQNHTLNDCTSIYLLIQNSLWDRIDMIEKEFLVSLSVLEHFTLREAKLMIPEGYDENKVESFLGMLATVSFDKSTRIYRFCNAFINFLHKEFELLSKEEQKNIITKIGKLHLYNNNFIKAYEQFYNAEEWELIYSSNPTFDGLYPYINEENKKFFLILVNNFPKNISEKHYYFLLIMCFVLFMFNEKERIDNHLKNLTYSIEENASLSDKEKQNYFGMIYFTRGYTGFNDIPVMHSFYKKSLEYSGLPVLELTSKVPFSFGCPSVFHMYHRDGGAADEEVNKLADVMYDYQKLSGNHGKGADALFKAELLYNRGELDGSEILCNKVLYMATGEEQTCIVLGALLLLTRISIFDGNYDTYSLNLETFGKKVKYQNNDMDMEYKNMIDMCESFMHVTMNDKDKVADWLTSYDTINSRINMIGRSYANIIYSKYLCISKEYNKFLGISGQFLELEESLKSIPGKIYIYICIAIANLSTGNKNKAKNILGDAVEMAGKDMILMPFAENMMYIESIFNEVDFKPEYSEFIKAVKALSAKYMAGYNAIKKNACNKENYGLTARESDVAKLAAQRYSNKQIGEMLFIAESTVKSNLKVIFSKLGITSRTELSRYFK